MPNTIYTYQPIDPAECIGDSVYKINNNNNFAANAIGDLETRIATLSAALNAANLALTLAVSAAAPVGAVQTFAMASAPTGWLECNGVTVPNGSGTVQGKTANFAPLYAAVASTYGALGKLPDLRGEFVRGWDNSRGIDSGRAFGTTQADAFKAHKHDPVSVTGTWAGRPRGVSAGVSGADGDLDGSTTVTGYDRASVYLDITTVGGTETRPRNVSLLYCIKY